MTTARKGILVGQTDRLEVIEECMTMAHAAVRVTDDQTGFGRDAIVTISIGGSNWVRSAFDKGRVIRRTTVAPR